MRTFKMIKTDVPGKYVTEQVVIPDPEDTVQFVYADKDPVTAKFYSGYMQCHECPLVEFNTVGLPVCSSSRRTMEGLIMPMCAAVDGSLYRITRIGDVMEDV